ncbi:hypothetical protein Bamb_5467 [Burkholderia ambifaria AMMD]|uniref:Uncharacterized protein n=1 Tax=Burkholderia ambifaria (strain ATCC BAA-244 / DSM 16087 / CCUG 44356 / LMG 19182 / AMMD) TaxID=339670 RepID=Q0B4A9_BURCM|nr:hypothetical protein Bamb_5467 [Burkholderia ambifaria AMMD]
MRVHSRLRAADVKDRQLRAGAVHGDRVIGVKQIPAGSPADLSRRMSMNRIAKILTATALACAVLVPALAEAHSHRVCHFNYHHHRVCHWVH